MNNRASGYLPALAAAGAFSLVAFLVVFVNIPWQWSMFMDDTLYNAWMPNIRNVGSAIKAEISVYWQLGRFYPVKYVANLLKWRFLPNDPYVFRYFNLGVFLASAACCVGSALLILRPAARADRLLFFVFLLGSVFLHKPLLEVISINPLGETWVFFFFSLGSLCLFARNRFVSGWLARLLFVLVCLSKEPAALVFLASAARYAYLCIRAENAGEKRAALCNAAIDAAIFAFFLSLAFYVMSQGSFTRGAYFSTTPWGRYTKDFFYKIARYALWTSPFLFLFAANARSLMNLFSRERIREMGAVIFFSAFGAGYLVFMSTQGIVAYQDIPASMAFFCLFSLLAVFVLETESLDRKLAAAFVLLFCFSFFISVSRWERFVRGIVEPRLAMENLLSVGGPMTVVVPVGEISGHVNLIKQKLNPDAVVLEAGADLAGQAPKFRGKLYFFEFPFYMGPVDPGILEEVSLLAGGWVSISDAKSYRIYRSKKEF